MSDAVALHDVLHEFLRSELLADESVGLDDNLLADGVVDSIGVMRLVAFVDERFGCRVPFDHVTIENFGTLRRLGAYVQTRLDSNIDAPR